MGLMTLIVPLRRADDGDMKDDTHQCPYCELRFRTHNEIKDHILTDHPEHASVAATADIIELPH